MSEPQTGLKAVTLFIALPLVLLVAACFRGTYTPPQAGAPPDQYDKTVEKSFDDTWSAVVEYASRKFFAIDHFEKASGLMTLTFGSSDPTTYIDCGWLKGEGISMPYAQFLSEERGGYLDGKMNLLVKALEPKRTLVRVNARYIFKVPPQESYPALTWVFDSGSDKTLSLGSHRALGSIPTRTCRPTYAAEQAILDAVSR